MLPFFTNPYSGELIYSAIARYHFYSGNIDIKDTLEELFSSRSVVASIEIGSRFSMLIKNIGSNYSVEKILANHTIYPYYAPFLSKKRQKDILSDVEGKGSALYGRLGMVSGGICKKDVLYYCAKCAIKDIEEYGESYIHCIHQLQGIDYCADHELILKKYPVDLSMKSRFAYIRFDKKFLDLSIINESENNNYKQIQIKLAKMAKQLFHIPYNKYSREDINLKYRTLFREQGFLTRNDRIRMKDLYKCMELKFPKGFLDKYESEINFGDGYNWLKCITRNVKSHTHPFRHLLLIYFLEQDVESFMQVKPDQGPFGEGPWPCLNKAASHYKKDVISEVKIKRSYKSTNPMGEFSCSCGFVYVREGPDVKGINRDCIMYVKNYGDVLGGMAFKLRNEGVKLKDIAEKMGVQQSRIEAYLYRPKIKKDMDKNDNNKKIIQYRTEMKNAISLNPNYNRTQFLEEYTKIYRFLLKHDKDWLNDNLPTKQKKINKQIVDWNIRDQEFFNKIKEVYKELLLLEKPVRITPTLIGKKLNIQSYLTKKIYFTKLPITYELLNEITESVQDFQYRRCCKIIDKMIDENIPILIGSVRLRGGLSPDYYYQLKPKLEKYIYEKQRFKINEIKPDI